MSNNNFIAQIVELAQSLTTDHEKFFVKQQNAAASRLRKGLKAIADVCKAERKNITEVRNGRKAKTVWWHATALFHPMQFADMKTCTCRNDH